jgi:hypothetical protein
VLPPGHTSSHRRPGTWKDKREDGGARGKQARRGKWSPGSPPPSRPRPPLFDSRRLVPFLPLPSPLSFLSPAAQSHRLEEVEAEERRTAVSHPRRRQPAATSTPPSPVLRHGDPRYRAARPPPPLGSPRPPLLTVLAASIFIALLVSRLAMKQPPGGWRRTGTTSQEMKVEARLRRRAVRTWG